MMKNTSEPTFTNHSHKRRSHRAFRDNNVNIDEQSQFSAFSLSDPSFPLRRYFSRRHSSQIHTKDLPFEKSDHGIYTPAGIFFATIKLTVPLAYIYIILTLLAELCARFPQTLHTPVEYYFPSLSYLTDKIHNRSTPFLDSWAILEAVFYIFLIIKLQYLQYKCPLEASLSSAPLLESHERLNLWNRVMECEKDDPIAFITGWFFDEKLDNISRYDVRDFVAWSMFDARNQEHLSAVEVRQLNGFMAELERRIGLQLFGAVEEERVVVMNKLNLDSSNLTNSNVEIEVSVPPYIDQETKEKDADKQDINSDYLAHDSSNVSLGSLSSCPSAPKPQFNSIQHKNLPQPRRAFRFHTPQNETHPSFFSNLYENYKHMYEQYRAILENSEFHPVKGFRNFFNTQREQAEKNAMATANQMYENASHLYENATNLYEQTYYNIIDKGGEMDKQISAFGHATHQQLMEAWNSMREMKGRLEMAKFISSRKKDLRKQLKGYQLLLDRTREMSSAIPSKQMAELMRKITQCNDAMERIESSARDAYVKATGFAQKNLSVRREPQRYAKYSYDPLLGVSQYPLMFHLLILAVTEGGLRILLNKKGFVRRTVGQIAYYYHPGKSDTDAKDPTYSNNKNITEQFSFEEEFSTEYSYHDEDEEDRISPIVFVHGIGIGLIYYVYMIDRLLTLKRPLFLPEIPYVTGFRTWLSPQAVLSPGAVGSNLTAMLATHGFLKASFIGHSYGTSWLSYMCKYSPNAVESVTFLDPICFCLHTPFLTKQFVYHRPDPGSVSNFIRTDVIINWTIQRSFPWSRISLFVEEIPVDKVTVFLSEFDLLVPVERVKKYLTENGAKMTGSDETVKQSSNGNSITLTMFNDIGHGDWVENENMVNIVVNGVKDMLST